MFATFASMEQKNVDQSKLRVVSVEGVRATPDFIEKDASLLDWVQRLQTLNQDSKFHTMNYFVETMLKQKDHQYHQIFLRQTSDQNDKIYYMDARKDLLNHMAQEMIFSKQQQVAVVLEDIIKEIDRFQCNPTP